ncbi:MAG: hypothetical protein JRH20_26630 [Deltaproteobacteria bacterium]|nr:hypothetical protein [Deltaproteobacteria bacterium]
MREFLLASGPGQQCVDGWVGVEALEFNDDLIKGWGRALEAALRDAAVALRGSRGISLSEAAASCGAVATNRVSLTLQFQQADLAALGRCSALRSARVRWR